jgi:hypothetical protein
MTTRAKTPAGIQPAAGTPPSSSGAVLRLGLVFMGTGFVLFLVLGLLMRLDQSGIFPLSAS